MKAGQQEWVVDDSPKEECGVLGLYIPGTESARLAYFALYALQHRGQESAGLAVSDGTVVRMHKGMGLVGQVFNEDILGTLRGELAVGHTRYSTTGHSELDNAQPVFCTSVIGDVAVAHNGNLVDIHLLKEDLLRNGHSFYSSSDSEVIARLLSSHLEEGPLAAVRATMAQIRGAYSVCVLVRNKLLAFRDPHGVRPLVLGRVRGGWMVASESCALSPVDGEFVREIRPGELVVIDENGLESFQAMEPAAPAPCLFELIYFARPDSRMEGSSVSAIRTRMGEELAREHPAEADVVVPVPDSGIPAARGYSKVSGIPYADGMMKNRYIHRTFIQPDQRMREMGVRMKLAPLHDEINGKRIVLVDDSIVRATTTKQIVRMLLDHGAAEVHVRITAPPIKWPCFYGIDMASRSELAAATFTVDEIRRHIGATSLGYLSVNGTVQAAGGGPHCLACFTGNYPIDVSEEHRIAAAARPPDVGQMTTVSSPVKVL
ncbi:MAG: amidophosphoribosyltransferase [Fimbriimonadaceae bacterium]|nr:amidophosphoribosyltransferase [Fimbriimonadaceae bacterium]QYK54829.1 MAG: amidophosphoribosyltransferase [Fimbriimonadaceae bacterium]